MAISVDVVISGKTETSVEGKTSTAVVTTNLQEDKLGTKGGIISGSILPHQTDAVDLGSPSKRFLNLYAKTAHLAADSLKLGDEATISAGPGGGFSFDTEGETIFGDIKVKNLTVTGTQSVISSTDLAVKDNIIIINSGEAGAGITLTSGGLVIDRGTLENATILFNDNTDRFELNFPIAVDGSELALAPNLIVTGQTLQGQITTNDTDIANLTTNLQSTGSTVAANLITTGQTLTTNLASTGSYLTTEVNTLSGLSVFHSMTGNFATHIKDLDDVTLAGNQGKYLKVNSAGDGISYDIPPVTGVGGEGGGAVKFTGLVDAPNDYSSLQTEFPSNGGLVAVDSSSESLVYLNSGTFATDPDLTATGNTLDSQRDTLSGNLISTGNALDASRDTLSGNLISTGNNLQAQITSNDSDIASINTNIISTGNNLETQIIGNDADITTLSGNLITTGTTLTNTIISTGNHLDSLRDILSGNLISSGNTLDEKRDILSGNLISTGNTLDQKRDTLSGNLISSGNTLDSKRDTLSGNLITTGQNLQDDIDTVSGNLISTGNNLQSQITSNDSDISTLQTATGEIQDIKLNKAGGTISGEILPNASGTINLGSPSLPFRSGHFDDLVVSSDSIKIGSEATLSSPAEGGIKFDTTGTITFGDVSIKNLTVTGTRTIVETTDTAIKDNIIVLNSGEDGAGITLSSGGLVIDRGSATDANILFNDSTDQFEVNFPLSVEGSLAVKQSQTGVFAEAANLITTGQTLQTQITSNDTDITSLTSNLASTGSTLDSEVTTLTTNLASTGSTLAADIVTVSGLTQGNDTDLATVTSNLITTGQTLTDEIAIVSGLTTSNDSDISTITSNLITTGQTLQSQITSNDSDISTITSNLVTTGQTLQTQITSNDSDITTLTSNLVTTGQTLQTQITSNDSDISTLTSNLSSTGSTLDSKIDTLSGVATLDSETGNLVDTSMTGDFAVNFLDLDDTPGSLGAVGQSVVVNADRDGLIFSGVSAGGGGGSSTFVGLSDTPGALTASRLLAVNSAGNSVEFLESGTLVTDAETGVFATSANLVTTGQTLTTNTNTVSSNLVSTGSVVDDISGNLITTGQTLQTQITSNDSDISTLTSNLVTTGQTLTTNINTVSTNLVSTGSIVDDVSGNLITTGQTLQTQITSNDSDITTLTSNLVSTGAVVDDISGNLITTGQTLQTQITSNDSDITTLTSNLASTGNTLDTTTVKLTSNQTIAGNKTFSDTVTIGDLNVTGTQTTITATNLAIKDNLIEINSGESGAGISLVSGGITINRGSAANANILFNDSTDRFELNFPLAADGSLVATAPNLITTGQTLQTQITSNDSDISTLTTNLGTTGQTLQTQITSNDSDISTLTSNLVSTGSFVDDVSGNLITTGQTLQTQITSNDGDITTLTSNLVTTGQTLQTQITSNDGDITTLTSNLVTTGQTLTTNINTVSTNLVSTGKVVDDVSGNLITTGQTLQTQITSNDSDITTLTSNLITTGQTLTSEISTLSGLATLDSETGSLIDTSMTGDFADTTILESFAQGLNVGTSSNLASRKLHVVGDVEISGTIYQSGSVFEGGGGGGGSSTFVGLSDTPGSFTASKFVRVNPAGNALVFVDGGTGDGVAFSQIHTGDGTTTNFAIPSAVDNVKDVLVSVEGLVQIPTTDYTLAGTTGISFTTGVTSGHLIDIRHLALGPSGAAGADGSAGDLTASGFTDGSGVAGYAARWSDSNTLTSGVSQDNGLWGVGVNMAPDGNFAVKSTGDGSNVLNLVHSSNDALFNVRQSSNDALIRAYKNGGTQTIQLHSDGASYMTGGNVGIGIAAPTTKLHISYPAVGQDGSAVTALTTTTALNLGLKLGFSGGANSNNNIIGGISLGNSGEEFAGMYALDGGSSAATDLALFVGTTSGIIEAVKIDSSGNVGIGTNAPAYRLEVKASVTGDWISRIYNTATTSNPSGLLVRIDDADSTGTILGVNNNGTYHMVVKGDGKVGIGTGTPSSKLHVDSEISCGADDNNRAMFGYTSSRFYLGTRQSSTNYLNTVSVTSGKVGIGTDAPAKSLQISAADGSHLMLHYSGSGHSSGAVRQFFQRSTGTEASPTGTSDGDIIGTTSYVAYAPSGSSYRNSAAIVVTRYGAANTVSAPAKIAFATPGASDDTLVDRLTILPGGKIGIGTTDPDNVLHVYSAGNGEIKAERASGAVILTQAQSALGKFGTTSNHDLLFMANNTGYLRIKNDGKVGFGCDPSVDFQVGNSVSGETKVVTFNSEGGAEVGLRVKSRTNRAKLAVSDNDTTAYIVAEGGARAFGPNDTAHANNLIVNGDGNVGVGTITPSKKFHVVGDIEISGTIYQSGSVFEGGGGGGGSSTFVGLSDTPGSLTANRVLTVNAAGNAVETTYNASTLSGHQSVEQGYFTGLTLGGTGTGILQNASGTISNLDLADNKFDVSVIEERDTVVGDANFSDVSLLLPFDGSNEATSTSDSSDSGRTITLNSNVELSTTQSKFGGTSLYVPGSSSACQIGGDFSFAGDFTIEFWEYIDTRYNDSISIGFNASSTNYVWHSILYGYYNGGTKIKLYSSSNGSSWNIANAVEVGDKLDDQWVHRALVRSGSTWYSFQNGTEYWSADLGDNALNTASQYHWLGRGYNSTSNRTNEGYYDDVRVTLGVARYTSDFTAPSAAFPTSQNITAAKYIGQIGGIDDTDVDYGIEKLSNSQLMVKKLSDNTFTPDRLYVNVTQLGALGQGIAFDQVYTGDGTTTNYLLSEDVSNARDVLVSVEGLIQTPIIDYTLAGTTGVSFTTGVVSGHEISFRHLALGPSGAAGASADISYLTERFTGNGVVSGFEMSRSISTADEIFVFVNGLVQDSGANFSVTAGTGLYFTDGEIVSGDKIMVRHVY